MSEIKLAKILRGNVSDALLSQLNPFLEEIEGNVISEMKQDHRAGTLTYERAISHTSKLVVLEDLKENLKSKIKIGNKIMEEMNNDNRE
jgi:hypothetical protein